MTLRQGEKHILVLNHSDFAGIVVGVDFMTCLTESWVVSWKMLHLLHDHCCAADAPSIRTSQHVFTRQPRMVTVVVLSECSRGCSQDR